MAKYSWNMTPGVLGMSVLTVSPGMHADWTPGNRDELNKSLVESGVIALIAAHLMKSWWPLAAPALYLSFNYMWNSCHATEGI